MAKYTGAFHGTVNTTDFIDATISVDDLTTGAARKTIKVSVADLAGGADLAEYAIHKFDVACTILAVSILNQASTASGVDDSNTSVHTIRNGAGGSTIVAETFDSSTAFVGANTEDDLGTVANTSIAAGGGITYQVTNGATANLPAYWLIIEYE